MLPLGFVVSLVAHIDNDTGFPTFVVSKALQDYYSCVTVILGASIKIDRLTLKPDYLSLKHKGVYLTLKTRNKL